MASGIPYRPGGGFRFLPNPHLERELLASTGLEHALHESTEEARKEAQRIAEAEAFETGAYMRGLVDEVALVDGKLQGRIVGTDFKSGYIEFGTEHQDPKAIMRRATENVGLRGSAR